MGEPRTPRGAHGGGPALVTVAARPARTRLVRCHHTVRSGRPARAFHERAAVPVRTYRDRLRRKCRPDGESSDAHDYCFATVHDPFLTPVRRVRARIIGQRQVRRACARIIGQRQVRRAGARIIGQRQVRRARARIIGQREVRRARARIIGQRQVRRLRARIIGQRQVRGARARVIGQRKCGGLVPGSSASAKCGGLVPGSSASAQMRHWILRRPQTKRLNLLSFNFSVVDGPPKWCPRR